jgi:RNase P/RNase MRP subunit p30
MEEIILTQKNFTKLKEEVKQNKEKIIVFSSGDDDLNRKVLEKLPIKILLISLSNRKDFQKQRNSGFNQVMAKFAKKKNIIIGINLDELIQERDLKKKSELFARLKQNIFICNKNKVKMKFIINKNKRKYQELKSLGIVLGMPTWMLVTG